MLEEESQAKGDTPFPLPAYLLILYGAFTGGDYQALNRRSVAFHQR